MTNKNILILMVLCLQIVLLLTQSQEWEKIRKLIDGKAAQDVPSHKQHLHWLFENKLSNSQLSLEFKNKIIGRFHFSQRWKNELPTYHPKLHTKPRQNFIDGSCFQHYPKWKITRTLPSHKIINELYLNVSSIKGLCNCFFKSAGLNMDSYNNFTQYLTNTDTPDWIELDCMSVCCMVICWVPHQICTK